jgi:hypothetical protein
MLDKETLKKKLLGLLKKIQTKLENKTLYIPSAKNPHNHKIKHYKMSYSTQKIETVFSPRSFNIHEFWLGSAKHNFSENDNTIDEEFVKDILNIMENCSQSVKTKSSKILVNN